MWTEFFSSAAVLIVFLFLPGALIVYSIKRSFIASVGFAPIIGVFFYSVAAVVYSVFNISCSWLSLFLPYLAISIIASMLARRFRENSVRTITPKDELLLIAAYAVVGIVVLGFFFVGNLDGADSFFQASDNGFHLSVVRTFVDSGTYSSFRAGYGEGVASPFASDSSFYPAAWHCLVAMAVTATAAPITVAVNALNFVSSALIFPLAVCFAMHRLFGKEKKLLYAGTLLALSVAPFPWGFLTFGPLYPNLLSMSMFPAALIASLRFVSLGIKVKERLLRFGVVLLCTVALLFSQPNSIFAELIFVISYFVCECFFAARSKEGHAGWKSLSVLLLLAFAVVVVWLGLYSLPVSMMRNTVEFNWPATVGKWQAIVDCALLSFNAGAAQPWLAVLVFVGGLRALSSRRTAWLAFSYIVSCLIYISSVSTEGLIKHVLSGFWYTDPYRLAAIASVASIPLALLGLKWAFAVLDTIAEKYKGNRQIAVGSKLSSGTLIVLFVLCLYGPNFVFEGCGNVVTAFGNISQKIERQNNAYADNVLTHDEKEFAKEALQKVPEDELILNEPNDGSEFLYALYDAKNLFYRQFALPSTGESTDSVLVRQSLDEVASSPEVAKAVRQIGAKYVLLLDQGGDPSKRISFWSYYPDQWQGFNRITDETPGFEIVMADGDMRLYKIIQ